MTFWTKNVSMQSTGVTKKKVIGIIQFYEHLQRRNEMCMLVPQKIFIPLLTVAYEIKQIH